MSLRSGKSLPKDFSSGDPDEEHLRRIVSALKKERLRNGLTLRKLSAEMGVDFTHVSRSERGLSQPGLVILMRWCRALNLEIESLIRDTRA
ncbi:helix-turn-helix domain-containing protein [Haloferula sargassicola]|uniref:helix-turn-helix domain-containing protein n=1 Tax=Haloferula sargassicola TaxID=490096 RepID=UPI0033654709